MFNEKPLLKIYKFINNSFIQQAIIDDYQSCSFERNMYQAGQFTITINSNIPNASKFKRGLFVQFSEDVYDVGEIQNISYTINSNGKGSQIMTITGYDLRYLLKRRVIVNLNSSDSWSMTNVAEVCLRNLIKDQCGENAEEKRRIPIINEIPENPLGSNITISEAYSNLYEVVMTTATQSELGWKIKFDENLTLEFYQGNDKSSFVSFSTDYESLASGNFTDSTDSYTNAIYIGGKGEGSDKEIYEGEASVESEKILVDENIFLSDENGNRLVVSFVPPSSLDRFECYDNDSELTSDSEYNQRVNSLLSQYMQTITVQGTTLAKSPYLYKKDYDVGDTVNVSFDEKSANVQILSVTEQWSKGSYSIQSTFGKPKNNLSNQLQIILRKIQLAGNKSIKMESVKWYEVPELTEQSESEVIYNTLGFTGSGGRFTLYLDDNKVGSKNYNIYGKNLSGDLILETMQGGEITFTEENFVARIYIDTDGNILKYS